MHPVIAACTHHVQRVRRAATRRFHRVGHLAHAAESGLHVAYLGGVALGGGYQFVAGGMLVCIFVSWACSAPLE